MPDEQEVFLRACLASKSSKWLRCAGRLILTGLVVPLHEGLTAKKRTIGRQETDHLENRLAVCMSPGVLGRAVAKSFLHSGVAYSVTP